MPQLEFWHFLPQFVWLAICFVTLYCVMAYVALPRIGGVLAARRAKIEDDLGAAERARGEADEALHAHEASLARAREEARDVMARAARGAAEKAEARARALDAELAAQIEEAQRAIAAAKGEALDQLGGMAAEAARDATARLIGIEVSGDALDRAVAAAREG